MMVGLPDIRYEAFAGHREERLGSLAILQDEHGSCNATPTNICVAAAGRLKRNALDEAVGSTPCQRPAPGAGADQKRTL